MLTLYTVDRERQLRAGADLSVTEPEGCLPDSESSEFREGLASLCPTGLSRQGLRYIAEVPAALPPAEAARRNNDSHAELIWELVRRAYAPDAPSRLQSAFGWGSKEDAQRFRDSRNDPNAPIYTLEVDEGRVFQADMELIGIKSSGLVTATYAMQYWRGEPGWEAPPLWEYVVPLPIRVGTKL